MRACLRIDKYRDRERERESERETEGRGTCICIDTCVYACIYMYIYIRIHTYAYVYHIYIRCLWALVIAAFTYCDSRFRLPASKSFTVGLSLGGLSLYGLL